MSNDTETLQCVGGPFDREWVTTDRWTLTLLRVSPSDLGSPKPFTRSTYIRERAGLLDIWRFQHSEAYGFLERSRYAMQA